MKKMILIAAALVAMLFLLHWGLSRMGSTWAGVDETVVEAAAKQAGRSAQTPWINTEQGDLLLFVFLAAGAIGGFVAGYCYRELFGKDRRKVEDGHGAGL